MSFFSKVRELMRMVFGSTFTEEQTRSHNRLCDKFINKIKMGVTDLKEIKQDLIEISEKGASKMVKLKMNKLIRTMKVKNSDAYKIKNEKDYKKFLNRELKRVYDLSSDNVKRVKSIIKKKKPFVPEIEEDIQFVVFPRWWDMDKEVYRALAKELTLDQMLDDLEGVEYGKVSVEDEEKWYSAKHVEKLNRYYDRHPRPRNICNQSIKDVLTYKGPSKNICEGCVEYKANKMISEMLENKEYNIHSYNMHKQVIEDKSTKDIVKVNKEEISNVKIKSKDDLFEIKDKNMGKRPRLKKNGFEFPHIIYCSTSDGIYQPQVFHPLQLARVNFHKRHPRFRKYNESNVQISDDEMEAERAYRKLLRKRHKEEIEMIECFLKDKEYFKNDIPNETCTMILNVNCEENRRLYENCVNYMKRKSEMLNKYDLTGDMNIKLKREINLDEDLSTQKLDPMEVYNELKLLSEEAMCMNEEDFPEEWYTDEKESDIEEGEGRVYSSKIEDRFTNPKYVVDNKMEEVVDHAEERRLQLLQESILQNKKEKENDNISVNEKNNNEDTFVNKKHKADDQENNSTEDPKETVVEDLKNNKINTECQVFNDAVVSVDKYKKSNVFKARKPAPKIKLDAYEQIIKRHDELIKKREDDDAEMERIGQKARKMAMEKLYGIKEGDSSTEKSDNKNSNEDSRPSISERKAAFFEQMRQNDEKKKLENSKQENKVEKNTCSNTELNRPDVSSINNDLNFTSKPLINTTPDNKEYNNSAFMGSSANINQETSSPTPFSSPMEQNSGGTSTFNNPLFGQQNSKDVYTSNITGFNSKDVNTPNITGKDPSISNIKIPGVFNTTKFGQETASSSFMNQFSGTDNSYQHANNNSFNPLSNNNKNIFSNNQNNNNLSSLNDNQNSNTSTNNNYNSTNPLSNNQNNFNFSNSNQNSTNPLSNNNQNNLNPLSNNNYNSTNSLSNNQNNFNLSNNNYNSTNPLSNNNQNNLNPLSNNNQNNFSSLNNDWIPTRQPDDWRPTPRFGGTICSPLDLPLGPVVKIDPAQHGPWGHIDLPDREPPKDDEWNPINKPVKREREPSKPPIGGIAPFSNTNRSMGSNSPILSFQPPNDQSQMNSAFTSNSASSYSTLPNNTIFSSVKQVSAQEIFNTNRDGGMFDSLIKDSNNNGEDDSTPSVQYRNMKNEENNGFNFFFK